MDNYYQKSYKESNLPKSRPYVDVNLLTYWMTRLRDSFDSVYDMLYWYVVFTLYFTLGCRIQGDETNKGTLCWHGCNRGRVNRGGEQITMFAAGRDVIGYAPIWDDDAIGPFSYHVSKAYKRHWFWNKHLESLYLLDLCIYYGIKEREKDSSIV